MATKPDISIIKNPVGSKPIYEKLARKIPCCVFCAAGRENLRYVHTGDHYYVICTDCGATGPKTIAGVHMAVEVYIKPFKQMQNDLTLAKENGYTLGRSESSELRDGLRQFAKLINDLANEPEE